MNSNYRSRMSGVLFLSLAVAVSASPLFTTRVLADVPFSDYYILGSPADEVPVPESADKNPAGACLGICGRQPDCVGRTRW